MHALRDVRVSPTGPASRSPPAIPIRTSGSSRTFCQRRHAITGPMRRPSDVCPERTEKVSSPCTVQRVREASRDQRLAPVSASLCLASSTVLSAQTTGRTSGDSSPTLRGARPGVTVEQQPRASRGLATATSGRTASTGCRRAARATIDSREPERRSAPSRKQRRFARLDGHCRLRAHATRPRSRSSSRVGASHRPTSTTTGTNYTSNVIARLRSTGTTPTSSRRIPASRPTRATPKGASLPWPSTARLRAENQWIIDGVNTTNVNKGAQGKAINNEFVQEVEVKTGGYSVEYGRALGGVVNVVTKSGGNAFHGDGFVYYDSTGTAADEAIQARRLRARPDARRRRRSPGLRRRPRRFPPQGPPVVLRRVQPGQHQLRGVAGPGVHHVSTEDRFPLDAADNLYSGKLTWNAASSTRSSVPSSPILRRAPGRPQPTRGRALAGGWSTPPSTPCRRHGTPPEHRGAPTSAFA